MTDQPHDAATTSAVKPKKYRYARKVRPGEGLLIGDVAVRIEETPGTGRRRLLVCEVPVGVPIVPLKKSEPPKLS